MVSLELVIFNSSGHTMALGLNQPLTEMSSKNISSGWRSRCPVHRADNLTSFTFQLFGHVGASNLLEHSGPLQLHIHKYISLILCQSND